MGRGSGPGPGGSGLGQGGSGFPMGPGNVPVQPTGPSLPTVVSTAPQEAPPESLPSNVIGFPQLFIEGSLGASASGPTQMDNPVPIQAGGVIERVPGGWKWNGVTYRTQAAAQAASIGQGHLLGPGMIVGGTPGTINQPAPVQITQPVLTGGDEVSLDLGNLLGQLGTALIQNINQPAPAVQPVANPLAVTPALGIPFVDIVPDAPGGACDAMVWNPRANCGAGKWQKRSRRRKKVLATNRDIKDLGALKSVLGPSALKTWIATHS